MIWPILWSVLMFVVGVAAGSASMYLMLEGEKL